MRCSTISRHITWLLIVSTLTCLMFSAISCMKNASPSKEMNKKFFKHDIPPRRTSLLPWRPPLSNFVSSSSSDSDSGLHVQVWNYVMCKATDIYVFALDNHFFVLGLLVYLTLSSYSLLGSMNSTMVILRWLLTVPYWLVTLFTFRMAMLFVLRAIFAYSSPGLAYINTWLANHSFGCIFLFLVIETNHPFYFQMVGASGLLSRSDFWQRYEDMRQCCVDMMKLYVTILGTSFLVTLLHLMNVAHPGIDVLGLVLSYAMWHHFHRYTIYSTLSLLGILRSSFTPGFYFLVSYSLYKSRGLLSDPTSYSSSSSSSSSSSYSFSPFFSSSNGTRKGTTLASADVFSNGSACALSICAFLFLF